MGIWGLQTYIRRYCEDAFEFVNLKEIATLYSKMKYKITEGNGMAQTIKVQPPKIRAVVQIPQKPYETGNTPVMLFDCSCCIFCPTTSSSFEKITGGGIKKFKRNIEEFINNCFNLGIRLKVVGEGIKEAMERELWVQKCEKNVESLKQFYSNPDFDNDRFGVLSFFTVADDVFQTSDKCEYVRSTHSSGSYIFEYTRKFNCFAIMTNDSDFILAKGAKYCLSSKDFDFCKMTTYNYNKNILAEHLNISVKQLSTYGSLLKNAFWDAQVMPSFFKKNGITFKNRLKRVAALVKNLPPGEKIFEKFHFYENSMQMNQDELLKWNRNLKFFCGLCQMDLALTDDERWNEILSMAKKRHVEGVAHNALLGIISIQTIFISPVWSNVQKLLPDTALLPLRKIIYGIIFSEHPVTDVSVVENRFDYDEDLKTAKFNVVEVKFKRRNHPGLLELWSLKPSENIEKVKREIFCQAVDERLSPVDLTDIREEFLFPFLAVFYLFWKLEVGIKKFAVDVLLIQAVLSNQLSEEKIESYPEIFDCDAYELSDWFVKTVNYLYILNSVCGQPFCVHKTNLVNFFDGKLLHYIYVREKEEFEINNSGAWDPNVWTEFEFLRNKLYQLRYKLSTHN